VVNTGAKLSLPNSENSGHVSLSYIPIGNKRLDRLAAMKVFVRVVETGSFSAIARENSTTQSSISKQVAALEAHLGAKLLSRSTRALSLTEAGESLFPEARRLVADFEAAEGLVRSGQAQLTGWLRVATSVGYGRIILMPRVQSFLERHPSLRIDLRLSDSFTDLIEQGIDVAVRLGELPDSSLVARKIGVSQRELVAHPAYFAKLAGGGPRLEHPRDLAAHNCIVYTEVATQNAWELHGPSGESVEVRVGGNLQTNSSEVIRAAALSGLGICHAPNWLLAEELASGEINRLLPQWTARPIPIHAVYPSHRRHVAKIDAFIRHLED
jgi:DNA-binding transcriptional LysR family regulator